MAGLCSHNIGLPPIVAHGSEALKQRVIPGVLAGEAIAALAITEPSGGSDVARLHCAARRDGDHWVIDGEKTADGVRPAHIKDRIRALGPTVRPDLTLKPADPEAREWVI